MVLSNSLRRPTAGSPREGRGQRGRMGGFSLAESLVGMAVSVTVLAGVLPVYFQAVRGALTSHDQSVAVTLASSRLEQLRGLEFRFEDGGAGPPVRFTDRTTDLAAPEPRTGGRGLAPAPPGCLLRDTSGYVDYLDAGGRWLAAGDTPPPGAHYARRWSVSPLPSSPLDALVLQVLVTPVAQELAAGARLDAARRPGDVWLTLVRTRVL